MLVLVTGGTGYVGSHSIAALAGAGHRIRVLARSPEKVLAALGPLGVDGVETAIGDVTEPAAVERALEGCEAVLHAASVFSMDARKADEMTSAMSEIIRTLGDLSGRRIRFVTFPAWFLAAFGRTADVVQRRLRTRLPWSAENIWIMNCDARCDDSKTRDELQLEPCPLRETFVDTVHWLVEVGHLTRREAGRLA